MLKILTLIGYVFMLLGRAISWKANIQLTIVLSTIEVEYIAATKAMKEAI